MRSVVESWNAFFFKPQSPTPLALYRIFYGLLVMCDLALLHGDWHTWYGSHAFMRLDTMRKAAPGIRPNLFLLLPQNDAWIEGFFWVFLMFALFLTVGFLSRFSSVAVFLCLISIHQRNLFILNSGDTLLRVTGFFLLFAPTGAAISVDRLLRVWRGTEGLQVEPVSPWAQRMIQIEVSLAYLSTFLWKMRGTDWIHGTALYYATRLVEYQRFPFPLLENGIILRLATWSALLIEFALGSLVWFWRVRYWVLLSGICLHLSIEYAMNIPLFQWIAMAGYVTFVDPVDLSRARTWLSRHLEGKLGTPVDVIYNGNCSRSVRLVNVLRVIDLLGRLNMVDSRSSGADITGLAEGGGSLIIRGQGAFYEGYQSLLALSREIPLLWPLAPLSIVSGWRKRSLWVAKAAK